MSPVTKFEDQPAVSLILVKPSSSVNLTPTTDSGETSRAATMQLIFELMLLIGKNMAKIQEINGQTQIDTAKIAQAQADGAVNNEKDLLKQLKKLHKEQEKATTWRIAGEVFKWVGVGIALCVGALLCETPIGFMILAATIAFTASPLFNMSVNFGAKQLEKHGIPKSWATIMVQVAIIVTITAASFGTEAATVGVKGGIMAVEDTAETGEQMSQKIAEEEIEEEVSETSTQAVKKASSSQVSRTSATTLASLQSLMSSNVITESISNIPGIKKYPWLVALLTVLTEIVVSVAAMKATPTSGLMNNLTKFSPTTLRLAMALFGTASAIGTDTVGIYTGYNDLQQSKTNKKIAPIQSLSQFEEGFFQIMTQLTTMAQQTYKQTMNANEAIFRTNFSSDMEACVRAQQQF